MQSLTSALDGHKWLASRPSCFAPREIATGTHWLGGWVGLRAGLDTVQKRKIPSPHQNSKPDLPVSCIIYMILYVEVDDSHTFKLGAQIKQLMYSEPIITLLQKVTNTAKTPCSPITILDEGLKNKASHSWAHYKQVSIHLCRSVYLICVIIFAIL
jgi:hypothetical protein